MRRVLSNGPSKDFLANPYTELVAESTQIDVASPYVTKTEDLLAAAKKGKVKLLVGLNTATAPEALRALHGEANIEVRFYTNRFHAKGLPLRQCGSGGIIELNRRRTQI
jgi:hypothetical protein